MGEMLRDLPSPTVLPGKCAPRFWADLIVYNPLRKERNFLPDNPPHFDPQLHASYEPKHKHVLDVIGDQSCYVKNAIIPINQTYKIAAICQTCRMHFKIEVEFTKPVEFGAEVVLCPNGDGRNQYRHNPLHHFRYESKISSPVDTSRYDKKSRKRWMDKRVFSCSSTNCPIVVTVTTQPAMIRPDLIELLLSEKCREARVKEAARMDPDDVPVDAAPPTPYQVLETLCTYLKNHKGGDQRSIFGENKRYLCNLGGCGEVMQLAHFTKSSDPNTNAWIPASPAELGDVDSQVQRDLRGLLEEVTMLMDDEKRKGDAPAKSVRVRQKTERAELGAKWLLGFHKYDTTLGWQFDLTAPEHPHYAGLGAVGDMSDSLINWAYERQRACDPVNAPYYFECFESIANGRKSENLQFEVARLRSEGQFSTSDLESSYKLLGVDPVTSDDDLIIGVFKSRLTDAPRQEGPMREDMRIIGTARRSEKILSFAKLAVGDVADAYQWLGGLEGSDDHFILSAYKLRVEDNPNDEITARNALKLIAENRQSDVLYSFLEGNLYETPLEIGAAYSRLGIHDYSLSEDLIVNVFELRKQDTPSQTRDLRAALRSIGQNRNSMKIQSYLETGNADGITKGSVEWPVGLENIGNTCYLNSLLQFYFTVKPLREMILNIDQFQEEEINDEVVERKRVGGRKVSKKEIERAKKFVGHLRILFQNLITSQASSVTPERDLAYLTLVSSKDEEEEERRISVSYDVPLPPPPPPVIYINDDADDKMDLDEKAPPQSETDDTTSEATLVNENEDLPPPYPGPSEDYVMVYHDGKPNRADDKENLPPLKDITAGVAGAPRSPLQDIDMNEPQAATGATANKAGPTYGPPTPPPDMPDMPDRPPPIPPRPAKQDPKPDTNLMFGRQQDVTECIGNVMFQVEAAIKPESVDENGEQIDLVKKLFYGRTKQTLSFPNSAETRTKEELFSHLLVDVAEGDRDIYSALDSSFDIEQVDLEGREAKRFLSISHLPPILQIQVQRVQYDRAKASAYKSNSHLKFPDTIYLDRYMETDEPDLKVKREESWVWKEELKALEQRLAELTRTSAKIRVPKAFEYTHQWLSDLNDVDKIDVQPALLRELEQTAVSMGQESESIEARIQELQSRIEQQFTGSCKQGYRIHSVFIHRGSASFGHYWIYIYDFQRKLFRKYNDGYVTEVADPQEVFTHGDINPPTPYFLVFVKEDQSLNIMEAVQRQMVTTTT